MASKGILEQQIEDFEKSEQRYQQQRRQYDRSYVEQKPGQGPQVFATNPSAGIFGSGSSTRPYELNDKGKPNTRKPGSSEWFYQPYSSFTGGINASLNVPAYIARTPESMKLESRTPVTGREYYRIPGDEDAGTKDRLVSASRYSSLERENERGDSWTDLSGAQKTNMYFDGSGRAVSASNTGDKPSKIVQGEDGQYYLETYSYKGEPKHTALRMYKSSRAKQEQIKAAENKVAARTARYMRSDDKDEAKKRKRAMDSAIAERDKLKAEFRPRFHGQPEFTAAEIRKLQGPDQSVANAERDGGRSQLQRVQQNNQWSPFASSNAGQGVLMRAMKDQL